MEYIQGSLFGKMFPEHSAATTAETSQQSSENLQGSSNLNLPMCLCLKKGGLRQEYYWCPTGRLLGELTMRNTGESPNAAVESHLSQILEDSPLPKYYLSARACQGILNRAKRRGKVLPKALEEALIRQTAFRNEAENPGGGKGILIQKDRTGALTTLNNQMVYKVGSYNSEGMLSDNPHSGFSEADVSPTLDLNGSNPNCYQGGIMVMNDVKVYDSQVYHGCKEFADGISQTVNAQYGTGGNNQPLVVSVGNGQLNQISMSDKANSLDTMHDQQAVMLGVDCKWKKNHVRRLTPLECERLQGLPDNWTNIPGASDSKRYRAIGNGIALPFGSTSLTALLRWAR